jgi:hypothetical protein
VNVSAGIVVLFITYKMLQQVIILLLFIAAVIYIGFLIVKSFRARSGCSSGCGSCGVDFNKIERDLKGKVVR